MAKVHKFIEEPTHGNTVMNTDQIVTAPLFINKTAAAEMFGISKSTVYKWLTEAEESGEWPGLSIRPSATITLIHVATMEEFLKSKNKSFL